MIPHHNYLKKKIKLKLDVNSPFSKFKYNHCSKKFRIEHVQFLISLLKNALNISHRDKL